MKVAGSLGGPHALANGVRYAALHRTGADVTAVSVWVLAGSRHESVPGVAHLLEHVLMQCVPPDRSARVVDEIEAWGGDANAMTTRDHVVLHARVPTTEAIAALHVLAAAVCATGFDDELVSGERRVVQEELRLAAADPTDIVHDLFFQTAYGDHPIGRPIGGTVAGVERLGLADIARWSAAHVRPATLAVLVCGGLTDDQVGDALAGSPLARLEATPLARPADSSPPVRAGRQFLPVIADSAGVVLGGPGFALADPMSCAAEIVVELLAGANSSVLNEEIRSRRGLSYDVWGAVSGYRETGMWRAAISTAPEQREFAADLAAELLTDAATKGWTEAEVDGARRRAAGLLRVSAESCIDEALLHGDHLFVGDAPGYSLRTHAAALAQTSAAEVNHAAAIMTERLVVATAGGD